MEAEYADGVILCKCAILLTVIMEDGDVVEIWAPGEWFICIEAFYAPTQPGYQRIASRGRPELHYIILRKMIRDEVGLY